MITVNKSSRSQVRTHDQRPRGSPIDCHEALIRNVRYGAKVASVEVHDHVTDGKMLARSIEFEHVSVARHIQKGWDDS